ncbi:hypothetical protein CDD83_2938 [Cordyceps sp. RAO-2017]|nr:hypothetical protein CDD83_2938 [Cordyceps sp. RAO-2017]
MPSSDGAQNGLLMPLESRRGGASEESSSDARSESQVERQDVALDDAAANRTACRIPGASVSPSHSLPETEPQAQFQSHESPLSDPSPNHSRSPGPSLGAWEIGWRYPALLLGLFAGTLLVATGHHMFYKLLDGELVESTIPQMWAIRIGNGLAFLFKGGVVAILSIVNTQQIWTILRRKFIPLRGIDGMFRLMTDPTALFNRHLWVQAKTLLLLASLAWLVPLVAVVTPATLSVRSSTQSNAIPFSVPTVKFDSAADEVHTTRSKSLDEILRGSHSDVSRLLAAVAATVSYVPWTLPFPNSSYELSFWAPSYKCVNISEAMAQQNAQFMSGSRPDNHSSFQPDLDAYRGELSVPPPSIHGNVFQVTSNPMAIAIQSSVFESEAKASLRYTSLVCQLYNTSFEIFVRFENGVQSIAPRSVQYLNPVQHLHPDYFSGVGMLSYKSGRNTRLTAPSLIHRSFTDFLVGNITISSDILSVDGTSLMRSGLAGCVEMANAMRYDAYSDNDYYPELCRNKTLARAIEDLSRNLTYSFMAPTYNLSHHYATVPVTISSLRNFYAYDRSTLITTYLASLSVVLLWMGVGALALWRNGITSSASFSTILCTTRNPDLDTLARGHSLGADPLPDDIAGVKLKFGYLQAGDGKPVGHAGFGLQGTVTTVKKVDELL